MSAATIQVDPILSKALLRAGIQCAGADGRLTESQLDALRAGCGDNISKRIQLVTLADRAGILPAAMKADRPV